MRPTFVELDFSEYPQQEMVRRARTYFDEMRRRRSVREFSARPFPLEVIEQCIRTAGSAPSGAHKQPWHFVVVSDPEMKRRIRQAAEAVEREFYESRATDEWLQALAPLGTGPQKPFLETAPYLIVVFVVRHGVAADGGAVKRYYPLESAGIATGMLIAALHHAGLAVLPYTPAPMGFLNEVLRRPERERPLMILVTGYPADDATVPDITKKPLDEIATFL